MNCYETPQMHIGTCFDDWNDTYACTCAPIDASQYAISDLLCCVVTIPRVSNPRLKTYFNDKLSDDWNLPSSHTWCGIEWSVASGYFKVRFDFCDGDRVIYSRETIWGESEPEPDPDPDIGTPELEIISVYNDGLTYPAGDTVKSRMSFKNPHSKVVRFGLSIIVDRVEYIGNEIGDSGVPWNGTMNNKFCGSFTMPDHNVSGIAILKGKFDGGEVIECDRMDFSILVKAAEPDPCDGVVCDPKCFGDDMHNTTCDNGVCIKGTLIESNSTDCGYKPPDPDPFGCTEGDQRGAFICPDGSMLYSSVCRNNEWIPTDAVCPSDPSPEPEPDPDEDKFGWEEYVLIGLGIVIFYLIVVRG